LSRVGGLAFSGRLVRGGRAVASMPFLPSYSTKSETTTTTTTRSDDERSDEALEAALKNIDKVHGTGTVMKLGSASEQVRNCNVIPTGSLQLDSILGVGGLPRGRVCEIYGPEASGKTTLALHIIAEAQKRNGTCVFVDAEHALDREYADRIGVDTDNLLLSQPDTGEQALDIVDTFIRSSSVDVICVDSVAALVPKAELEGAMTEPHMALQARLMSKALRKISHSLSKSGTLLVFLNQVRQKINMGGFSYGITEYTSGGTALKYYSSVRMEIRKIGSIKRENEIIGHNVRVKVAKNKVAPPFKQVQLQLEFGKGLCPYSEVLDLGLHFGLLQQKGSWFAMDGENIGQGRESAKEFLRDTPQVYGELRESVRKLLFTK